MQLMSVIEIVSVFKKPLDNLLSFLGAHLQQIFTNRLIEYQVEEYKRNYYSKTILHRSHPIPISNFYQPLYLSRVGTSKRISTGSVHSLFQDSNYITIIGTAGSGKSTILKYLFVRCFQERLSIPIKVELRYLNDYRGSFKDYVFNEIFKFQKIGISDEIIDQMIGSGNFIFFLDGYDEVRTTIKANTTKEIDLFVSKYSTNKFLITSRPYANIDLLPMFSNYNVCSLNEIEKESFIRKQLTARETELAEKIIAAIEDSRVESYTMLLSNPLLLSMFILTFQSYSDIPTKHSDFYSQVFETLFSFHDSISKLAYVREKRSGLSKDQFKEVLRLFSFVSFFEQKFVFTSDYLNDRLDLIKSKKSSIVFDNSLFVDDLQVAIGLLYRDGIDYAFPHRSLQEYFAVEYIGKLTIGNKGVIYGKLIKEIKKDFTSLLEKEQFYKLLTEVDHLFVSQFLVLPLLRYCHRILTIEQEVNKPVAFKHYGALSLVFRILLSPNPMHTQLVKKVFPDEIKYVFDKRKLNLEKDYNYRFGSALTSQEIIDFVKKFYLDGQNIIGEIERNLIEFDKSDEEIIDLF